MRHIVCIAAFFVGMKTQKAASVFLLCIPFAPLRRVGLAQTFYSHWFTAFFLAALLIGR